MVFSYVLRKNYFFFFATTFLGAGAAFLATTLGAAFATAFTGAFATAFATFFISVFFSATGDIIAGEATAFGVATSALGAACPARDIFMIASVSFSSLKEMSDICFSSLSVFTTGAAVRAGNSERPLNSSRPPRSNEGRSLRLNSGLPNARLPNSFLGARSSVSLFAPKQSLQYTGLPLVGRNGTSHDLPHSAQVAFPGGKYEDTDSDFAYTALRETQEEVGVNPQEVELIKPFTPMYIPPSNFMVHPFLGFAKQELRFVPDPSEVARIIELPLAVFLDESIVIETRLATSYSEEISVPAFNIEETIVWGATAMMLSELKEVLKSVFEYKI